jgi:hypothetical protein
MSANVRLLRVERGDEMRKRKKQKSGKQPLKVGIAWYRPEQWGRLRQISDDVNKLEESYEEWLSIATKTLGELQAQGMEIEKVEIDINELQAYCNDRGMPVNAKSRSEFVTDKLRKQYEGSQE